MTRGTEKRQHVEDLREAALAILSRHPPIGNVEIEGRLLRFKEFRHNELRMQLQTPLRLADGVLTLAIWFNGPRVLLIEWEGDRLIRTEYVPGAWESVLVSLARRLG